MAQTQPTTERVADVVEAVNERGVRLAGTWHNFSRFADVPRPMKGAHVELVVKGGWIQSLEVVDDESSRRREDSTAQPASTRERTITRLSVLKAAAEYCASRPDAKAADVLKVATAWEAWVLRDDEHAEQPT